MKLSKKQWLKALKDVNNNTYRCSNVRCDECLFTTECLWIITNGMPPDDFILDEFVTKKENMIKNLDRW